MSVELYDPSLNSASTDCVRTFIKLYRLSVLVSLHSRGPSVPVRCVVDQDSDPRSCFPSLLEFKGTLSSDMLSVHTCALDCIWLKVARSVLYDQLDCLFAVTSVTLFARTKREHGVYYIHPLSR